jgi:tripartite-type tricarboxylate transporter receptor subunit TctC
LVFVVPHQTKAETWLSQTIRIVVPYPAGGNVDAAAGIIANKMQTALKLSAIDENILNDAVIKKRFAGLGSETVPTSRAAFAAYLETEEATWLPLIRNLNIKH